MKPAHERNQECLPPKKRDLPVESGGAVGEGGGGAAEAASTHSSGSANSGPHEGGVAGDWMRLQPALHYGVENSDAVGIQVDPYGMLYKVAVPSVTFSPTSLHPVLSHIPSAYTLPSPLLQHPGIPYPPLGYAQIPHSSLQFVGSSYTLPYAVPPGFVPNPLMSPQSAVPQAHHVSHLVPCASVIQEGVVAPPPQPPGSTHTFANVATAGLVLSSEQAAGLPSVEASPRVAPVVYRHPGARAVPTVCRNPQGAQQEWANEINGGAMEHGGRGLQQESVYPSRNAQVPHGVHSSPTIDHPHDGMHAVRRPMERGSPGQRSTPDTDLEVQRVVGCLASPSRGVIGSRGDASSDPLNLSQGSQRSRDALRAAENASSAGLSAHVAYQGGARVPPPHPRPPEPSASPGVMITASQPVLVPLDHHQRRQLQHASLPAEETTVPPAGDSKISHPPARLCRLERDTVDPAPQQQQQQQQRRQLHPDPAPLIIQAPPTPPNSSHFMKGAIIQLATGELKRVEDLQTQDFVRSAEVAGGLKIDSSMVVDIRNSPQRLGLVALHFSVGEQQSKVTIDVPPEHPFFVFGQGWSSCSPDRTAQLYGLDCHRLQVGDVCVSVTLQKAQQQACTKAKPMAGAIFQPMGPPAPLHLRPQTQIRADRTPRDGGEAQPEREEGPRPMGSVEQGGVPSRPSKATEEPGRRASGYHLPSEGQLRQGVAPELLSSAGVAPRRWSSPGFRRYGVMDEEAGCPSASLSSSSRPSFIPQEVKLSIEGRSNAGK